MKWRILEALLAALLPAVLQLVGAKAQRESQPQGELPLGPKL